MTVIQVTLHILLPSSFDSCNWHPWHTSKISIWLSLHYMYRNYGTGTATPTHTLTVSLYEGFTGKDRNFTIYIFFFFYYCFSSYWISVAGASFSSQKTFYIYWRYKIPTIKSGSISQVEKETAETWHRHDVVFTLWNLCAAYKKPYADLKIRLHVVSPLTFGRSCQQQNCLHPRRWWWQPTSNSPMIA